MTRPLSAGSIAMLLSFFSRFGACCSSFVKLLLHVGIEADCTVVAILLLMLSLADSDKSH